MIYTHIKKRLVNQKSVKYHCYQIKTLTAGVSYDVNTSKFIAATNRRGGFEIYVTYIFKKIIPFAPKTRVCPIYM